MSEQEFEDYKSKYLDLYDKVRCDQAPEKVSVLQEVDFELEPRSNVMKSMLPIF